MLKNNLRKHEKKGTMLLVIISLLGLVLEGIYYFYFALSDFIVFYVILVIVVSPTLYAILFRPEQKYLNLFLIFVASLFFTSMYLFYSLSLPYVPPSDPVYHFQITDAIVKTHHIPIIDSARDPYSSYALSPFSQYPAYHLALAVLTMITGLDASLIIKISPMIALIGPFIIFSLSKYVLKSDQISFLAAFLWIFVPFSYPLPSYTLLAYIFLPLFFIVFLRFKDIQNQGFFVASVVVVFALSLTHHFTIYILLVFLPFLFVFERIVARISNRVAFLGRNISSKTSGTLIFSFFVLGIIWTIFWGSSFFTYFVQTLQKIILGQQVHTFTSALSFSSSSSTFFEKIFKTTSFALVGLLGLYGLTKYVVRGNWRNELAAITIYFGFISLVALFMANLSPNTSNIATRAPEYLFIGLGPLFGYAVVDSLTTARGKYQKVKTNVTRWLIILLLVCLSISVVDQMPRDYYFFRNEQVTGQLWAARSASSSISNSLQWYSSYTASSALGISDVPIHDIGTGMYNLTLTYYDDLYVAPSEISRNAFELEEMGANYVFVDKLMSLYTEQWTYLIYSKPIPVSNLDFIEQNYTSFDAVYSNGIINILCINK